MPSVKLEPWQTFPSDGGGSLAFDGDRLAVAGSARLGVWKGNTHLTVVESPTPAPGVPRFAGERVYWGSGYVDLASRKYVRLAAAEPARWPGGGERPHLYAWSPRGDRLLGSFSPGQPQRPTRVTLFDGHTGGPVATLWSGSGLPPAAAWLGQSDIVVGFGNPRVFDRAGKHQTDITLGGANVSALDATESEERVLAVDLNQSIAWIDARTWTVLDRWPGPWLHGAVSPDGRLVAALEPWGKLHFARLQNDHFRLLGTAPAASEAVAVALASDAIATVGGGELRRARLALQSP